MNPQILLFIALFSFLLIITLVSGNFSNLDGFGVYGDCSRSFSCGNITGVGYPFRSYVDPEFCGYPGLVLRCEQDNITTIDISSMTYQVLSIDQNAQYLKIVREDVVKSTCPQKIVNTSLDHELFDFVPTSSTNLTFLYGCPDIMNFPGRSFPSCQITGVYVTDGSQGPGSCNVSVVVPISTTYSGGSVNSSNWDQAVQEGFEVKLKVDGKACDDCTGSNGHCGYDPYTRQAICYCPNQPYVGKTCVAANAAPSGSPPSTVTHQAITGSDSSKRTTLSIVFPVAGAILAGISIGWLFFFCRQRRKRRAVQSAYQTESGLPSPLSSKRHTTTNPSTNLTRSIPSYPSSNSDFAKSNYFGVQVFTYAELEKATDKFDTSKELGDGGFGTVYYGKLVDGREVAVKHLYENNFKRLEQFINEVEILARLEHENLVKLYGCTSKRSRELLLVYEYISNGTVADHLHGKRPNSVSGLLSWPVRLNIAIETACALTYLHESDIIHRDVKTNNILLDNNFHVKVADFGLSRLFPNDATHVSTAPQGTPGYVDPEYYQCYQLTDKSDVYSFGVVLIELLSSLEAVDTNRHRHHINLSNMAVDKIQNHMLHELVDKTLGFETDNTVRRMTTLVAELAFRCLQQDKDMRPTMKEVLEILRGIQNDQLNGQKPEVLDIVVDNGGAQLKDNASPPSPGSSVTDRLVGSTPNSSS